MEMEETSLLLLQKLKESFIKFSQIFSYDIPDNSFFKYLKTQEKESNQICAKKLSNVGGWECKNCGKDSTCIICIECYENSKEKHIGHQLKYKNNVSGCCDCGDPDAWNEKSFCSKHSGIFNNDNDIDQYIKSCFDDNTINNIQNVITEIVTSFNSYILDYENNNYLLHDFNVVFNFFLNFIHDICNNNLAILHIVSKIFLMNFPEKTKHFCFNYCKNENNLIEQNALHDCCCPFISNLLSVWNSQIKNDRILFLFLKDYKLKTQIGLIFFAKYDKIIGNHSEILDGFFIQVISDEVSIIISKNLNLLTKAFENIYTLFIKAYKKQNLDVCYKILIKIYSDIHYLIKPCSYKEIGKNINIYKTIIDIAWIIHNSNYFQISEFFIREGFNSKLLNVEIILIKLFDLLINIFDSDNIENVTTLLNYFAVKITNPIQILNKDEYSFHITLYRFLSIFLNKFCFIYSMNHHTNLLYSINYAMNLMKDQKIVIERIIKDLFKFFGFINSIQFNFWVYYGQRMNYYIHYYYDFNYNYYLYDITLFKYIFSLKDNSSYLSIDKILELCSVNDSHEDFNKYIYNNKDLSNEQLYWCYEDKFYKYTRLNSEILNFITKILRDNTSMIILFTDPFQNLAKNKILDEDVEYIYNFEKENILDLKKEILIHLTLSSSNLITYNQLIKGFKKFFIQDIDELSNIINELTDQKKSQAQEIKFSIKNKYLNNFDLNYIFNPFESSKAEKYIMDFKKNEINIVNTYFYKNISIQKELNLNCYYNFYFTENNLEFIIRFYKALIQEKQFNFLKSFFSVSFAKFILILLHLIQNDFNESLLRNEEKYKNICDYLKSESSKLIEIFENIKDDTEKKSCEYLKIKISNIFNVNIKGKEESVENGIPLKTKTSLKIKEKFKKKIEDFTNKNKDIFEDLFEDINNNLKETCVYCKKKIDENDFLNNPFGLLGMIAYDKFIYNSKEISLKKEYEKIIKEPSYEEYNSKFIIKNNKDYNIRLLTCNHIIHIKCYNDLFIHTLEKGFKCPLCKKLGNILIPSLFQSNNFGCYIKGISIENLDLMCDDKNKEEEILNNFYVEQNDNVIIQSCKNLIEGILSDINRKNILLKDLNSENDFIKNYKFLIHEFHNFFYYYNITNNKQQEIGIWGNFFLSFRFLLKIKEIKYTSYLINRFIELIKQLKNGEILSEDIFKNKIDKIISEILFLTILLFEKDSFIFEKNLFSLFITYNSLSFLIKSIFYRNNLNFNQEKFIEEVKLEKYKKELNDSSNLKDIIINLINKIKISKMILTQEYEEKENEMLINDFYPETESLNNIIFNNNLTQNQNINLFKTILPKEEILDLLFEKLKNFIFFFTENILIPKKLLNLGVKISFNFISLPKNLLSLISKYNSIKCDNCGKIYSDSFICLICGKKFCNKRKCGIKINNGKINSSLYHNIICNGNNTPFLLLKEGRIYFFLNSFLLSTNYCLYLDKFGQKIIKKISNDFELNDTEYNKALNSFIDLSYRKYFKNAFLNVIDINNYNDDDDEEEEAEEQFGLF